MDRRILAAVAGGVILLAIAGVFVARSWPDNDLVERPQRFANAPPIASANSVMTAQVEVPYAGLAAKLNKGPPLRFEGTAGGYSYAFVQEGPVRVGPGPSGLRLTVPVSAAAHLPGLAVLSFERKMTATADLVIGADENWCATVKMTPTFDWSGAPAQAANPLKAKIEKTIEPRVGGLLDRFAARTREALGCGILQTAARPLFREQAAPLDLAGADGVYLALKPRSAAFSGLRYDDDAARFVIAIHGTTEVVSQAPAARPTPALPKLAQTAPTASGLKIALPVRLGYDRLQAILSEALVGKTFTTEALGRSSVIVDGIELYPAGERLVVGLTFRAQLKPSFLSTAGKIYFVATPELDAAQQVVSLTDVSFTRGVDNRLWSAASAIFKKPIVDRIEQAARIDLKPPIQEGRVKLALELAQFAQRPPHIKIALNEREAKLSKIVLTERTLEVLAVIEGDAGVVTLAPGAGVPPAPAT